MSLVRAPVCAKGGEAAALQQVSSAVARASGAEGERKAVSVNFLGVKIRWRAVVLAMVLAASVNLALSVYVSTTIALIEAVPGGILIGVLVYLAIGREPTQVWG